MPAETEAPPIPVVGTREGAVPSRQEPVARSLALGLVLLGFFVVYLLSLSGAGRAFSGHPAFASGKVGGDERSYRILTTGPWIPDWDYEDIKKHPLFPLIAIPLYRIGRVALGGLPLPPGASVAFPFALLGVLNLVVVDKIFRLVATGQRAAVLALLFTTLYGGSFIVWVSSSSPESYAITMLLENLLLLYLVGAAAAAARPRQWVVGGLAGLCLTASLGALLVLVLVTAVYVSSDESWDGVVRTLTVVGLIVLSVVALVYAYWYVATASPEFAPRSLLAFSRHYGARWIDRSLTRLPRNMFAVIRFFFVDAISYTRADRGSAFRWAYLVGNGGIVLLALVGSLRGRGVAPSVLRALIIAMAFHVAFHTVFNPRESLLYAPLILVPWLVTLAWGLGRWMREPLALASVAVFTAVVLANNLHNYLILAGSRP